MGPKETVALVDAALRDAAIVALRLDARDDELALPAARVVDRLHDWRDALEARESGRRGRRGPVGRAA